MINEIHLTEPAVFGVFGSISFVIAQYADSLPEWVRVLFMLLTVVFMAFLLVELAYFSGYHLTNIYKQYRTAASTTPDLLLVQNVRQLNSEQIQLVQKSQQNMRVRMLPGGADGPIPFFVCDGGVEVPQAFVRDFFEACDDKTLVPVREYNDSEARIFASAVTSTLVGFGYAVRGSGNKRSTWIKNIEEARKFFGV